MEGEIIVVAQDRPIRRLLTTVTQVLTDVQQLADDAYSEPEREERRQWVLDMLPRIEADFDILRAHVYHDRLEAFEQKRVHNA